MRLHSEPVSRPLQRLMLANELVTHVTGGLWAACHDVPNSLSPSYCAQPFAHTFGHLVCCCHLLQVNIIETHAESLSAVVFHSFHLLLVSADNRGYIRVNNGVDGNALNTFHVTNGEP